MIALVAWAIVIPLGGAGVAYLLGRRFAPLIGLLTALCTSALVFVLAWYVVEAGPASHTIGGWRPPLGIDLYVDGLSAMMLVMTAVVGMLVSLYAIRYFRDYKTVGAWSEREAFWPLWLFLWAALNALFLSADIFNLYVGLEVMTLSAVALIVLARGWAALAAGMRYLLIAFVGSLFYLLGVALLYAAFGTLNIFLLAERVTLEGAVAGIALMTVGLALKTAVFPFHFWLPFAHANAPTPVSAILSALVVKASFYVVVRLRFYAFLEVVPYSGAQFLGLLGTAGIVWGSIQALGQSRLKLLIAYSTVAQIGYLFLLMPLSFPAADRIAMATSSWHYDAWSGGIYHAVSHAFAKAALFLAAGTIMHSLGDDDRLDRLRGIAAQLPLPTIAFGLAGINLLGVPPSGGFVAKWLLLSAAIASGQWWWAVVLAAGGLLSAAYIFRVLNLALEQSDRSQTIAPASRLMEVAPLALAVIALVFGLRTIEPLALIEIGNPFELFSESGM